ncbi:hypothetical protein B4N89_27960 [Embleya scabrispora]|uniref:Uncharacterized protein n=1 Tax=Embleya scabrispora TaxID=159449 RepID=A0A1T3P5B9_9ACTN|nr:hypothetical protein [Embleya scabrispora]OPC84254.1 hypothetical protein B4N89_27960 [Embleya scabrispora]
MPDELTVGELGRSIDALRGELRDGMAALNARLDRMVTTEVYAAQSAHTEWRMAELARELEKLRNEAARLEDDFEAYQRAEQERRERDRQTRLYSAIIPILLGVLAVAATIWAAIR